ncbi:MAG: hypothetical protein EAX96_05665 [Candidatus Lokiarchaeota archaeon]|nr:hypothetical protein [Candidatus Lokiarchaeota archaeon]
MNHKFILFLNLYKIEIKKKDECQDQLFSLQIGTKTLLKNASSPVYLFLKLSTINNGIKVILQDWNIDEIKFQIDIYLNTF